MFRQGISSDAQVRVIREMSNVSRKLPNIVEFSMLKTDFSVIIQDCHAG